MRSIVAELRALADREGIALPDEAADEIDRLRARIAELEAARGEPVVFVRVAGGMLGGATRGPGMASLADGDHALYTAPPAPTVDVDAISDAAIEQGCEAMWAHSYRRAIFNTKDK